MMNLTLYTVWHFMHLVPILFYVLQLSAKVNNFVAWNYSLLDMNPNKSCSVKWSLGYLEADKINV